jgi:CRISPR-associated protein Cmr3
MSEVVARVRGRDPLLFGDGRPFGDEPGALRARSRPLPTPGALAGFLRSGIGEALGWDWSADGPARAREVAVAGPLLEWRGTVLFPAPVDARIVGETDATARVEPLRPVRLPAGAGCDLPPGLLPLEGGTAEKPRDGHRFWPAEAAFAWLANAMGRDHPVPAEPLPGIPLEERVHVAMNHERRKGEDGRLFTTEGRAFGEDWSLLARVRGGEVCLPEGLAPFGGERRLADVTREGRWPACPMELAAALGAARCLRLQLATPARFTGGWRPGWLSAAGTGSPPGVPEVTLRLAAAAVPRREAVSGWDWERRAPKAVRWLAPAGAVYFFWVERGEPAALAARSWLEPVSDDPQDRQDGYGLALWGVWKPEE